MNELVKEWIIKAKGDFHTVEREIKARKNPNWDGVCFHCQQAIEKLLKALLQKNKIKFTKIHDLGELLRLTLKLHPELSELMEDMEWLTVFSVEFRYPGETATKEDAKQAFTILKKAWRKIFPLLS